LHNLLWIKSLQPGFQAKVLLRSSVAAAFPEGDPGKFGRKAFQQFGEP
jgi:hypothetical protein